MYTWTPNSTIKTQPKLVPTFRIFTHSITFPQNFWNNWLEMRYYVPVQPQWVIDPQTCPVPSQIPFPFPMQLAFNPNLVKSLFFLTIGCILSTNCSCNWISCCPFYVIAETTKWACCGMAGTFALCQTFTRTNPFQTYRTAKKDVDLQVTLVLTLSD